MAETKNDSNKVEKMINDLVEKAKKRIICYNIERKLLYSIAKISKKIQPM